MRNIIYVLTISLLFLCCNNQQTEFTEVVGSYTGMDDDNMMSLEIKCDSTTANYYVFYINVVGDGKYINGDVEDEPAGQFRKEDISDNVVQTSIKNFREDNGKEDFLEYDVQFKFLTDSVVSWEVITDKEFIPFLPMKMRLEKDDS